MPSEYKNHPDENGKFPKGVSNRNAGLEYISNHVKETGDNSGVVYFADDDNTYDPRIFEEVVIFVNYLDFYNSYLIRINIVILIVRIFH